MKMATNTKSLNNLYKVDEIRKIQKKGASKKETWYLLHKKSYKKDGLI